MISSDYSQILSCLLNDKYVTWEYFITKAAKGSSHASEILHELEYNIINIVFPKSNINKGDEWNNEVYEWIILDKCPFILFSEFADYLKPLISFPERQYSENSPINNVEYYDSLWRKGMEVDINELIMDASTYLFSNWSIDEYVRLDDKSIGLDYNSLYLVSRMLMLLISFNKSEYSI